MNKLIEKIEQDPFRLFFPLGIFLIMWGTLLWLPQVWSQSSYPVVLHRFLVLNGFTTCFIAGFLMTAAPRFSQSFPAHRLEIASMLIVLVIGIAFAIFDVANIVYLFSALQAAILFIFLARRLKHRKANPPFSFLMIPFGFIFWMISGTWCYFDESDILKRLYYEGVIASIIIGVGCRLIPAILGHNQIVMQAKSLYQKQLPLYATIPLNYFFVIILFWGSYFMSIPAGSYLRALTVFYVAIVYWQVHKKPQILTALTRCLWSSAWMIVVSFLASAIWHEGHIHATHQFFISGIVLLCLLVATRVVQAHGAKNPDLENHPILYWVTGCLILSGATRMTAILWPEIYSSHLGYSSLLLNIAVVLWSWKYLKYVKVFG